MEALKLIIVNYHVALMGASSPTMTLAGLLPSLNSTMIKMIEVIQKVL